MNRLADLADSTGTDASQSLRIRRSLLAEDYSYAGILRKLRADRKGKSAPGDEELAAEMAKKIAATTAAVDAAQAEADRMAVWNELLAFVTQRQKEAAEFEGQKAEMHRANLKKNAAKRAAIKWTDDGGLEATRPKKGAINEKESEQTTHETGNPSDAAGSAGYYAFPGSDKLDEKQRETARIVQDVARNLRAPLMWTDLPGAASGIGIATDGVIRIDIVKLAESARLPGVNHDGWVRSAVQEEEWHNRQLLAAAGKFEQHYGALFSELLSAHGQEFVRLLKTVYHSENNAVLAAEFERMVLQHRSGQTVTESNYGDISPLMRFIAGNHPAAFNSSIENVERTEPDIFDGTVDYQNPELNAALPGDTLDLAVSDGASVIGMGHKTLSAFTDEMIELYGPKIAPHLPSIFKLSTQLEALMAVKDKHGKKVPKPKTKETPAQIVKRIAKEHDEAPGEPLSRDAIFALVREKVAEGAGGGVTGQGREVLDAAIAGATRDLQNEGLEVTADQVRDIFTDYGKRPSVKMDALSVKMREIRRIGQLVSAARDANKGLKEAQAALVAGEKLGGVTEPLKTGKPRDAATQAVRDADKARISAIKELQEAAAAAGIPLGSTDASMKSTLAAAKTRMTNAIEDVKREIATKQRIQRSMKGVNYDAEATALKAELESLRKERDAIFGPDELTDEQRLAAALTAAKRNEENWNKKLTLAKLGVFKPVAAKMRPVTSKELENIKARTAAAREAVAELKAADSATQEEARERALEASIAALEKRLASGNIGAAAKQQTADTARVAELKARRDALAKQLADRRKAGKPAPDQELKKLEALENQLAKLIENKPKPEKASSVDTEEQAFAREQLEAYRAELSEKRKNAPFDPDAWLEKAEKAVIARTAKLRERIATGDVMPAKKKDRPTSPELDKARFKHDEMLSELHRRRFEIIRAGWSYPKKAARFLFDLITTSRAVITSADLSAVLRQGGFIGFAHPRLSLGNIGKMLQSLTSKEAAHRIGEEIKANKLYRQAVAAKLSFTDSDAVSMQKHEEAHMSRWINEQIPAWLRKIPVLGYALEQARRFTAASARAYSTFLNLLRMDTFELLVGALSANPGSPTSKELNAVANYVNVATGRGKLPERWRTASTAMNTVFFAPMNAISRFQLVLGQPLYGGTKRTRKLIAAEYARYLAGVSVVLMLAQLGQDDDDPPIETDARSSDFGKVRFGNTRLDVMSGMIQPLVFMYRTLTGETKTITGKVRAIRGADIPYGGDNWFDVAARFGRTKLAPAVGGAVDLLSGENVVGQPVTTGSAVQQATIPMSFRDIAEAMEENGAPKGVILSALALLGMGMNTFDPSKPKLHTSISADSPSLSLKVPVQKLDNKPARAQFQGF
jgi:hypothetical protein